MRKTILLIEDNSDIMKINSKALSMRGFSVLEAATLARGEELLAKRSPDLIVLDIMLPDGDGLRFCKKLRGGSGVPVLFLSALALNTEIIEGFEAGGDDYLTKPYDLDVLIARIEALLRRVEGTRRLLSEAEARNSALEERLRVEMEKNREETSLQAFGLTPREKEVALLLIGGCKRNDIRALLNISKGTVNTLCTNVYRKTACAGAKELMRKLGERVTNMSNV